jgi:hypothetical protein
MASTPTKTYWFEVFINLTTKEKAVYDMKFENFKFEHGTVHTRL